MKTVLRIALAVVALASVSGLALLGASESGEVLVLRTRDAQGGEHETRLWVVSLDGTNWLRAGQPSSGWYRRLVQQPRVAVVREQGAPGRQHLSRGDGTSAEF